VAENDDSIRTQEEGIVEYVNANLCFFLKGMKKAANQSVGTACPRSEFSPDTS
jgi:hypothetical protein